MSKYLQADYVEELKPGFSPFLTEQNIFVDTVVRVV